MMALSRTSCLKRVFRNSGLLREQARERMTGSTDFFMMRNI